MESLSKLVNGRSMPGILIFDMHDHLVYFNEEAMDVIYDFKKVPKAGNPGGVPRAIYNLCSKLKEDKEKRGGVDWEHFESKVLKNKFGLPFSMRASFLEDKRHKNPTHIMVILEKIVRSHHIDFEKAQKEFKLSDREEEVLELICNGFSNREIAEKLFIAEYTVKDHVKHILHKMGLHSRNHLITSLK